jgi:predicted amidohydrolase YtcJ
MTINRRRFIYTSAGALAGLSLLGCRGKNGGADEQGTVQSAVQSAVQNDAIVFRNGIVLPVDEKFSEYAALAIRGNKILAVGSNDDVVSAAGRGARVIDLDGRTVLPGLIEPHMHFLLLAGLGHLEDVGPFKYPSFDEALAALAKINAATSGEGAWVAARQFDPILLEPPRELMTRDLDKVVPARPAFVLNASGHIAYVNSKTLELAGINKDTPDPAGASYGRYEDGSPNGVLYGVPAHLPVLLQNPSVAQRLDTGFVDAGRSVGEQAAALGITTVCDQATGALAGPAEVEAYQEMYTGSGMKARIRAYVFSAMAPKFAEAGIGVGYGNALMRVAGLKMVTDGSNQGFTGRQREPYVGKDSLGLFYMQPEETRDAVLADTRDGVPLSLHGNGDAAIDAILDAVENAKNEGVDVAALRCRIEHCSILHDEQIERIKALGMVPSFLINHVHYWGHVMRDKVFGPEKVQLLDRCGAVEKAGIPWVMHSDAPVSPLNCLHLIRVAVERDLWKEPDTVLAPQEKVGVEAAIRAVTSNAARACFSEHEIGSLEPGKLADLAVLESDPRKVEPKAISDIKVSQTWMDGKQVFGG